MYYLNKAMSHLFLEPSEDDRSGFGSIGSRADFWRVRLSLQRCFLGEQTREEAPSVNSEQIQSCGSPKSRVLDVVLSAEERQITS